MTTIPPVKENFNRPSQKQKTYMYCSLPSLAGDSPVCNTFNLVLKRSGYEITTL